MLDRLVLADRAAKHHPLLGIAHRSDEGGAAEADRLGANQDALRIDAVQDVVEATAFLADAILQRHRQRVEKELVGVDRLAAHLVDLAHLDVAPPEVGVDTYEAARAFAPR